MDDIVAWANKLSWRSPLTPFAPILIPVVPALTSYTLLAPTCSRLPRRV